MPIALHWKKVKQSYVQYYTHVHRIYTYVARVEEQACQW